MVGVVQLVEHQVVILAVAGSSPVAHPSGTPEGVERHFRGFFWFVRQPQSPLPQPGGGVGAGRGGGGGGGGAPAGGGGGGPPPRAPTAPPPPRAPRPPPGPAGGPLPAPPKWVGWRPRQIARSRATRARAERTYLWSLQIDRKPLSLTSGRPEWPQITHPTITRATVPAPRHLRRSPREHVARTPKPCRG